MAKGVCESSRGPYPQLRPLSDCTKDLGTKRLNPEAQPFLSRTLSVSRPLRDEVLLSVDANLARNNQ